MKPSSLFHFSLLLFTFSFSLSAASLKPIEFRADELGGEFHRRIWNVATNHFLKIDIDGRFVSKFAHRDPNPVEGRYEGAGKLLDAGVKLSAVTGDARVRARTQDLFAKLVATMDADGYIGFWQRIENDGQLYYSWTCHEMEYLLIAFCDYARTFGDAKAREAAVRLGEYLYRTFPRDERSAKVMVCGYAEAFVNLYRLTGERKYLDYAATIPYTGPSFGSNQPLRGWKQDFAQWNGNHSYTCLARAYAASEIAHETGETEILETPRELLALVSTPGTNALLVTGGCSEGEHLMRRQWGTGLCSETCATAHLIMTHDSMMRHDGDLRHADIIERAIWNALFGANSPDGRKIRYHTAMTGEREWDKYHDGYCCCGNFRRAIGDLPTRIAYETSPGGLVIAQYVPFDKVFEIGGRRFRLTCRTRYPSEGVAEYVFGDDAAVELSFRRPAWCEGFAVEGLKPSYRKGDVVRVTLPMKWRLSRGNRMQAYRVALERGPLVFCLSRVANEALFEGPCPDFRTLALATDSITGPYPDTSVRPDGISAHASVLTPDGKSHAAVFTEFADPTGIETYLIERIALPKSWKDAKTVELPFEPDRRVSLREGVVVDTFGRHTRHIYKFKR